MDTILVAGSPNKEVVYSTTCFHQVYQQIDGSQLVIELVQLGDLPQPVSFVDWIPYLDAALDIVKGCLKIGAFVYPPTAIVLLPLAAVGSLIQVGLKFVPQPDKVGEKLKELEKTIFEVEKKMKATFNDLRSFVTETEFTADIINETAVLMRLMRNCLKQADEDAIANFREEYEKKSPLSLAYDMISLLELRSTNPLIMAMATEKIKMKHTFQKWEDTITGLLGQFVIDASGSICQWLIKRKNEFDYERIKERSEEVKKALLDWKEEIGTDEQYWEEMKRYMGEPLRDPHVSNAVKAQWIKEKLDTYLTNDAFYVIVYDKYENSYQFNKTAKANDNQFIEMSNYGTGNGHAMIYRSRLANSVDEDRMGDMRKKVEAFNTSFEELQRMDWTSIPNAGLVLLIGTINEVILFSNCPKFEKGPGWYSGYFYYGGPTHRIMLAGFH
uniref:Crystaline entomocidal protoxin n=1 Tax=Caenorhabditis tropicalis TaxID=1561998 RepID=A0A1I7TVS9_9PELO